MLAGVAGGRNGGVVIGGMGLGEAARARLDDEAEVEYRYPRPMGGIL